MGEYKYVHLQSAMGIITTCSCDRLSSHYLLIGLPPTNIYQDRNTQGRPGHDSTGFKFDWCVAIPPYDVYSVQYVLMARIWLMSS
jgi:hypothetical protein